MKYFITVIIFFFQLTAFCQIYYLQPEQSKIKWTGKSAFSAYELSGSLQASKGQLLVNNDIIDKASVIVGMKSLSSKNKDLTKHLKSKDFFDVNKYTRASFVLTKVEGSSDSIAIIGNLTIKDKTKPFEVNMKMFRGHELIQLTGNLVIDRTSFGIEFNSPSFFKNLGDQAIADNFVLELYLVFIESAK